MDQENKTSSSDTMADTVEDTHGKSMSKDCEVLILAVFDLIKYLDNTRAELEENKLVSYEDVQSKVAELCERVGSLEKHETVLMLDPLKELMAKMEDISRILGERQEKIKELEAQKGGK